MIQFDLKALVLACVVFSVQSNAESAAPVKISMTADTVAARNGELFKASVEVALAEPGIVSEIEISGEGWKVVSMALPPFGEFDAPGVLTIPFTAIPTNSDQPIRLQFQLDGRTIRRSFVVGPRNSSKDVKGRKTIYFIKSW